MGNNSLVELLYKNKYTLLSYTLLFSVLGCFSYFFMVGYTDIPHHYDPSLLSLGGFVIAVLVFNILGHLLFYVNEKVGIKAFPFPGNRLHIALYIVLIGALFLLLNYLMLVCVKWMAGLPDPFLLQIDGVRMMLIVWVVQLIMVGLIIMNSFYRQLAGLYKKASALEDSAAKAKYQALQNQLNPHFLFNNLTALVSEIEYNPKNATRFTHHLSDVYRYILRNSDQQLVSLRLEMEFLESYLFLHQVRMGDCIRLEHTIDNDMYDMCVPPLTLQLLVENVIKHNVISLAKPMIIQLSIDTTDRMLTVSNTIRSKKTVPPSGKGLLNLSERYRLLCGRSIEVKNEQKCFTVKVPLLHE